MTTSPTTLQIDGALVGRLIAEQFPDWAHLPISPVGLGGWDNRTFRLGPGMVVRLPSGKQYAAAVAKEQKWLPFLAPRLPLPIPTPLAMGEPNDEYPWNWSVYSWLEGEVATPDRITNLDQFSSDLAHFLLSMQSIDPDGGPTRRLRGGSLDIWDEQARSAIKALTSKIDFELATEVWETALDAPFTRKPVWYHGDVAAGNLLVRDGRLRAVIDFGGTGVGDPACDMTIAWTFLTPESRTNFRRVLVPDDAIWARGRGWALWKGMIVLAKIIETNPIEEASSEYAVSQVLEDFRLNS
jgi:aminoglycoside phosphotransferase (APT) family kinase protein